LNSKATHLLDDARQVFSNAGLATSDTVLSLSGVEWFPWHGSRVLLTLELCAKADGLRTERDNLCIRYQKLSASEFASHRARIAVGAFTERQLISLVPDLQRDRFDEFVAEALLQTAFTAEVLDLASAQEVALIQS